MSTSFKWPPPPNADNRSDSPSWAPVGDALKVPKPHKNLEPLSNSIPLLPTPPPPRDLESKFMSKISPEDLKALQESQSHMPETFIASSQKTSTTVTETSFQSQSTTQFQSQSTTQIQSASQSSQGAMSSQKTNSLESKTQLQSQSIRSKGDKISPPRPVPIAEPFPTVNFGADIPMPAGSVVSFEDINIDLPENLYKSNESHLAIQSVKAPACTANTPKLTGPPRQTNNVDPSQLPFASKPLPFDDSLLKEALKPIVTPKSVSPKSEFAPSHPNKKTDPVVAAPIQRAVAPPAQAAAPPKPSPMFGGNMPMPSSMPGMTPPKPAGVGAVPTKGVPGERTAPKRGRGVMNQAVASRIPVCANCQIQIRGPFVTALGKNWCPDHFCCATTSCRKQLLDVGFVEEQGALHCEDCYERFFAPTCGKCDKRIKGDCLNAVGKQFHPECFCCAYCGKVFGSGAFYLEDGLPYCETDWNDLFTTKCVGCGFPIEAGDRWVEALNNNYHSQCFKCSKCNKNLEGQSFYAKGGKPFCKSHAQRGF